MKKNTTPPKPQTAERKDYYFQLRKTPVRGNGSWKKVKAYQATLLTDHEAKELAMRIAFTLGIQVRITNNKALENGAIF